MDTGRYDGLVNEIYCFGPNGRPLIHKRVDANIQSIGISDDRKYVCCQNANNRDHPDGGSLLIFDIESNEIIHMWMPVTGWADSYTFNTKNKIIILHYKDSEDYRYTFSGELLDQDKWQEERPKRMNGYQLLEIANEQIDELESAENEPELKDYQSSIDLIHSAAEKDISPYQKSLAYKKLGEIHLKFNRKSEALAYFQKAIFNNPNIGLKRKVSQLEKELG